MAAGQIRELQSERLAGIRRIRDARAQLGVAFGAGLLSGQKSAAITGGPNGQKRLRPEGGTTMQRRRFAPSASRIEAAGPASGWRRRKLRGDDYPRTRR